MSLLSPRFIIPIIVLLSANYSSGQTMHRITHASGSSTYGNTSVTVTPNGTTVTQMGCFNGISYVSYAPSGAGLASKYSYSLNKPTDHVRMYIASTSKTQVMTFTVNGQHYSLQNADMLFPGTAGVCGCLPAYSHKIDANGNLEDTAGTSGPHCVIIDLNLPYISSWSTEVLPHTELSGVGVDPFFEEDTSAFIKQPYIDTTLCPLQRFPVAFSTNFSFNSGNVFIAQLSNASGSFASPVNIGSKTAATDDTVWCTIPLNTPAGSGYRIRLVSSSPADTSLDNQVNIRIKAAPTGFSNSSNSPICAGDNIQLTGNTTSSGITWAWTGPGSYASSSQSPAISNSSSSHAGDYILTATLNSTGCSLKDTTTVTVKALPDKPNANYNSPVCETKTLSLTSSSGTSGVNWGWTGPSGYTSSTQNPSISNVPLSASGNYISTATINGCSSRDTVTVNVLPKPNRPTAGALQTSLCAQQTLSLTASTVTSTGYRWYGPTGYTANTQNPTRTWMQSADAGKYFVYAELNGCISDTDSVAIVVSANPFVNIYPTPGQSICPGQNVIFTALPNNAGSSPGYQWYVNGAAISGANGVAYATTGIQDNDQVMCLMAVANVCSTPFTDTSNIIIMAVNPKKTPSVSITSDVDPSLYPNEPITFTATATDAGNAPQYQWKRNGKDVGGATSQSWGANANFLSDGDVICVRVKSNYVCPDPDTAISNCITLDIRLGVGNVDNNKNITIHPNPVTDRLTIESATVITRTELYDVVGRNCEVETSLNKGELVVDMSSLPQGNYILKLSTADGGTAVYKVVKVKS